MEIHLLFIPTYLLITICVFIILFIKKKISNKLFKIILPINIIFLFISFINTKYLSKYNQEMDLIFTSILFIIFISIAKSKNVLEEKIDLKYNIDKVIIGIYTTLLILSIIKHIIINRTSNSEVEQLEHNSDSEVVQLEHNHGSDFEDLEHNHGSEVVQLEHNQIKNPELTISLNNENKLTRGGVEIKNIFALQNLNKERERFVELYDSDRAHSLLNGRYHIQNIPFNFDENDMVDIARKKPKDTNGIKSNGNNKLIRVITPLGDIEYNIYVNILDMDKYKQISIYTELPYDDNILNIDRDKFKSKSYKFKKI